MASMKDIFDSVNAKEERDNLGITKEQQGDPKATKADEKKEKFHQEATKVYDTASGEALLTMDYVKGNEGYSSKIYNDTEELETIGYGFRIKDETTRSLLPTDVVNGKRDLTKEEADSVFKKRFKIAMSDAVSYMGGQDNFTKLTKSQKKGLIDMSYNMGLTSLNGFDDLRKALFLGDNLKAKEEVLNSKYAREDVPNRAKQNANLMLR